MTDPARRAGGRATHFCVLHFCWVQQLKAQEYVMLTLGLCPVLQSYMKKRVVLEVYYTITSFLTV